MVCNLGWSYSTAAVEMSFVFLGNRCRSVKFVQARLISLPRAGRKAFMDVKGANCVNCCSGGDGSNDGRVWRMGAGRLVSFWLVFYPAQRQWWWQLLCHRDPNISLLMVLTFQSCVYFSSLFSSCSAEQGSTGFTGAVILFGYCLGWGDFLV